MSHLKYIFLLLPILFFGQLNYEREWATYHHVENDGLIAGNAVTDEYGNLYYVKSGGYNSNNSKIFKFSYSGSLLWEFEFDIPLGYSLNIDDLVLDNEGNIVFCGVTNSPYNVATEGAWQDYNAGENDRVLGKLNSMGQLIWSTYFGGSADDIEYDFIIFGSNVQITPENNIVWQSPFFSEGMGTSGTFQAEYNNANHMISKFTEEGERIWTTYYGVDQNFNIQSNMVVSEDAIYVAGVTNHQTYFDTMGDSWEGNNGNFYISSFDFNGNRNWSRYLGGDGQFYQQRQNLALINDNIFLTGWTTSTNFGTPNSYNSSIPENQASSFLTSYTTSGLRQWATYLGENAQEDDRNNTVELPTLSSHGTNVFVSGSTLKMDMISTSGAFQEVNNGDDAFAMIFSQQGELQWGTFYGGSGSEDFVITAPFDGGFYLVGTTNSTNNIATPGAYQEEIPENAYDIFIVKFVEESLSVKDEELSNDTFVIYPNPAKDKVHIKINDMQADQIYIRLFSISGKLLKNTSTSTSTTELDVSSLTLGSYVIVVENGNKISSQKLLVQ